jgi:tetratricopeptide (TPR) repeat protein
MARRAVDLARESGDSDTEGRALFRMAAALTVVGDYHAALEAERAFLVGLEDSWTQLNTELGAKAYANLGQIYRNRRRHPEALEAYARALARFQTAGWYDGEANTRMQIAWLLMVEERWDEAEDHLTRSGELLSMGTAEYLTVHQLTHEALLRLGQERYADASELAREVLAPGRDNVTDASRATALYVAGMCAIRTGQMESARLIHSMAQEAAAGSALASVMNLVQRLTRAIREADSAAD